MAALVPADLAGGPAPVHIAEVAGETAFLQFGQRIAAGVHQVDSPVIDDDGHVYLTYSGRRGQQAPVSVYRVSPGGAREIFARGLTNPTSLALDAEGRLYVTSRFDGTVTRFDRDGRSETLATDLGVACGIVVAPDGTLIVGAMRTIPAGTRLRAARSGAGRRRRLIACLDTRKVPTLLSVNHKSMA